MDKWLFEPTREEMAGMLRPLFAPQLEAAEVDVLLDAFPAQASWCHRVSITWLVCWVFVGRAWGDVLCPSCRRRRSTRCRMPFPPRRAADSKGGFQQCM